MTMLRTKEYSRPRPSAVRSTSGRCLEHLAELLLEVADLVAQPGRDFELQFSRRGVHLMR